MFLQLRSNDRVDSHEAEDAGLPYGALLMGVASCQSRDQVRQFGTEVVRWRESGHLKEEEEEEVGKKWR